MNIYGKKTYLRVMTKEDMSLYMQIINDPGAEYMVGGWSFPVSEEDQYEWFESVKNDRSNLRFTIVLSETNEPVGMTNLVDIDWKNRSGFTGIKLFASAPKRKGIATDAVMALMRYCFEELQFARLDGSWVDYNTSSLALYKKCGWSVEGEKKNAVFKKGMYHSVLFGGILAQDYYKVKDKLGW